MQIITDKDIQWKYKNNSKRESYYVGGEVVASQDDTIADSTFIVCAIPKGAIVLQAMAYVEGTDAVGATVKSQDTGTLVNITPSVDADTEYGVETVTVDKVMTEATNVVVTFTDELTRGRVVVLVEILEVDKLGNGRTPAVQLVEE